MVRPRVGFIDVFLWPLEYGRVRACASSARRPTQARGPLGRLLCFPAAINARAGQHNNNNCWAGHAAHRARG